MTDEFKFVVTRSAYGPVTKVYRNGVEIERVNNCRVEENVNGTYSVNLGFVADAVKTVDGEQESGYLA